MVIGLALTVVLLLAGHWFPWFRFIGRKLPRLLAYTYGVAAIWIGFFTWRYLGLGDIETPLGLAILCIAGGISVIIAYKIDEAGLSLETNRRKGRADGKGYIE